MSLKHKTTKEEIQKRSRVLSKIFSSLFMSIGAVIIVVAFVPKSPVVSLEDIRVFSNEVTYRVQIIDEDQAIIEDSLVVVLENQFTYQEYPVSSGLYQGMFSDLEEDTLYHLKVMGNIGFGMDVFVDESFTTAPLSGGMIISNQKVPGLNEQMLSYQVTTFISDPFEKIDSTYLVCSYSYEIDNQVEEYILDTQDVEEGLSELFFSGYWGQNLVLTYRLYGTIELETVLLDELVFRTPLEIYGSIYITQILSSEVRFGVYPEFVPGVDINYKVNLYQNEKIIDSLAIEQMTHDEFHEMMDEYFSFKNLVNNKEYYLELVASYQNPETLLFETLVVSSETFITPRITDYNVVVTEYNDRYEVFITGEDPYEVFNYASYYIYTNEFDYPEIYDSDSSPIVFEDGNSSASFTIYKDMDFDYYIVFRIYQQGNYLYSLDLLEYYPI